MSRLKQQAEEYAKAINEATMLGRKGLYLEQMVSALIQKQAGELVARGFLSLGQAQQWASEQVNAVNKVLADIEADMAKRGG